MKITPRIGATTLAILLVLAYGVYYFVRPEPPAKVKQPVATVVPAIVMENNKLVEKKGGKISWELEAKSITLEKSTGQTELQGVQAVLYRDDGNKLTLVAQTGKLDSNKNLQLMGDVVATTTDGSKLSADMFDWQQATELITAKGKVRLERPDVVATADEAQTDKGLIQIRLKGNAVIVKGGK